ncbi:MAG TPA: histidine kinase, partial [Gammaproteobacteria bacterium]|nr:histidine kinase [Gammaproteobacteria bacterium]
MNKNILESKAMRQLRKRAEAVMEGQPLDSAELKNLSTEQISRLFHELDVHRVELEMQNEELRRTQDELEEALDKYTDLFDYAP